MDSNRLLVVLIYMNTCVKIICNVIITSQDSIIKNT